MLQEYARLHPVPLHGSDGDAECFGGVSLGKAAEEAALHDFRDSRVELRQLIQGLIDLEKDVRLVVGGNHVIVQRHLPVFAATLECVSLSRSIYEDVAHRQ